MRRGRLRPKHMSFSALWNVYNSCPAADMMARRSAHEYHLTEAHRPSLQQSTSCKQQPERRRAMFIAEYNPQ